MSTLLEQLSRSQHVAHKKHFNGVISGLQLCLHQHCRWTVTKAGAANGTLSQNTTTATAMASFQRYTAKPERWRHEQRRGDPGKLFYIIPRHNRANLSVHAHTYTCWNTEREEKEIYVFFSVQIGNNFRIALNIDCMEKKYPAGFRFTCAAFSAMSSNYNNELRRSNGTQTPRTFA